MTASLNSWAAAAWASSIAASFRRSAERHSCSSRTAPAPQRSFQVVIDHPGIFPGEQAKARVGLARAHTMAGDTAKARKAYEDFFEFWKRADPDLPLLIQAKAEYASVKP